MRPIPQLAATLVALTLTAQAQTPVGPLTAVSWDHSGLDVQGEPEDISYYELAAFPPESAPTVQPLAATEAVATCEPQAEGVSCRATLGELLTGLPVGLYQLRVRAVDAAGNRSGWSNPLEVDYDPDVPDTPTNFRITVAVTVTVDVPNS